METSRIFREEFSQGTRTNAVNNVQNRASGRADGPSTAKTKVPANSTANSNLSEVYSMASDLTDPLWRQCLLPSYTLVQNLCDQHKGETISMFREKFFNGRGRIDGSARCS